MDELSSKLPPEFYPVSWNEARTVGLIDCPNPKTSFIGEFRANLLKEWVDKIIETFGDDALVYLSLHKTFKNEEITTAKVLGAAEEHGDTLQVMVAGTDCDDVEGK